MVKIQEEAILVSLGLPTFDDSDSDSKGSEDHPDAKALNDEEIGTQVPTEEINQNVLMKLLVKSNFNWIALSEMLKEDIAGANGSNLGKI